MYKRINETQLKDVKKYRYGCEFDKRFLESVGVDEGKYDVVYLWFNDEKYIQDGHEFYVFIRDKKSGFAKCGCVQGNPDEDAIRELILFYLNDINNRLMDCNENGKAGYRGYVDKRKIIML